MAVAILFWLVLAVSSAADLSNIVIILADDMGWNDVSFHGSNQFMTPNIDALACSGVILQDYYTQPICTPARAALLTGRHPIHNGMEHDVIYAPQPWGLPLTERLLPQYLQMLGYENQAVGKWHLGFFKGDYTPTKRGFDSHYGSWLGHQDHFTHMGYEPNPGYDFHTGLNVSWDARGIYAADLFKEETENIINNHNKSQPLFLYLSHHAPHAPLQAPEELITKFSYIPVKKRQIFAAMVAKVVGRVTQALLYRGMLNNTIILFLSDNGGATHGFNGNVASNWPLRGGKDTLWEGGVRGVGLIWSPLLQAVPRVHHGLINVQDWVPTLLAAVNGTQQFGDLADLDGVSQWNALNNQTEAPYDTMLHNIDPDRSIGAIRVGKWKLVTGRTYNGAYDGHYGELTGAVSYDLEKIRNSLAGQAVQKTSCPLPESYLILNLRSEATVLCHKSKEYLHVIQVRETNPDGKNTSVRMKDPSECSPHLTPCLFNIDEDPCEFENVASSQPKVVQELLQKLAAYKPVPPNNKPKDPRSYPEHWNHTWTHWQDFL